MILSDDITFEDIMKENRRIETFDEPGGYYLKPIFKNGRTIGYSYMSYSEYVKNWKNK